MPTLSGNISSSNTSLNGDVNNKETKWGLIGGTLSDQTDLQNALDDKQDEITNDNKLSASLVSGLSTVATSGSYNDLSNKPTIGDASINIKKNGSLVQTFTLNQENDQDVNIIVPTKTSDITKDDVYTKTESNTLLNAKADKSTTYTKTETDTLLGNKVDKVSGKQLSTNDYTNQDKALVDSALQPNDNVSELVNDAGYLTSHQSLSNYYTKSETDTEISNHHDSSKQDVISDLSTIRSGASLGATSIQPNDNVSELVNDVGYLTEHQSLSAYRTASAQDVIDLGLQTDIDNIEEVIPSQASSSNQLADKNFVNSSISTSTATFRGTSATGLTEQQFIAWANSLTHDENDYVFWNTTDTDGNVQFKRYKYDGTQWLYEYTLNNSSFTANQWATIQSGLSSSDKTKLDGIETGAEVNDVNDVQINGTSILSGGVANIPIAQPNTLGVIQPSFNYGTSVFSNGILGGDAKTYSQYINGPTQLVIAKTTLENVLDNESVRVDKAQSLTDTQKDQSLTNIGVDNLCINQLCLNRTLGRLIGFHSEQRAFDFNKYYVGISRDNYYNESLLTDVVVSDGEIQAKTRQSGYGIGFPISVYPNQKLYFKCATSDNAQIELGFYDKNGYYLSNALSAKNVEVTIPNECYICNIVFLPYPIGTLVTFNDISINCPSTDTSYHKYRKPTGYINDIVRGYAPSKDEVVKVTSQSLTDAQKQQARSNINANPSTYLTTAPTQDNTNGFINVFLTSEPATYYQGYIYYIGAYE